MYTSFFGFERMPFNGMSNSDGLFEHASFRNAEEQLRNGISRGTRLLLLTAERGTGKTVLLQMLQERLEQDGFKVCWPAAGVSLGNLRGACDRGREPEDPLRADADTSHRSIGTILAGATPETPVVFLADDADVLDTDVVRSLVELAGSDSAPQKWLRIVMTGTPNLTSRLREAGAGQLIESAAAQTFLAPLTEDEVSGYVARKLETAGSKLQGLFDEAAIREVSRCSGGVPRRIDTLCGMALLIAYDNGKRRVESAMVAEAVNDLEGDSGELRSRFPVGSHDDVEPTNWSAIEPGPQSKAVTEEPHPCATTKWSSPSLPSWRAVATTMLGISAAVGRVIRRGWRTLRPSLRRRRDKSWRYGAVTGHSGALGAAGSRQERDWLGLKLSVVGFFAIAVVAVLVGVITLDRTPASSSAAITEQDLSALRQELRDMRNALTAANAAQLESERIIAEQQALMEGYEQRGAALETELANTRNPSPIRLALPHDVVLTMSDTDGRKLRIEPVHMDDQKVREIVLVGNVDLRKISSLLAVADHEEQQPEQRVTDGFGSTASEALKSAFKATSDGRVRAAEATGERPAAGGATPKQPPALPSERDPAQRLPIAAADSRPQQGDAAMTADQITALQEREPPAAGAPGAAGQTAYVAAPSQADEGALPEQQPRSATHDAATRTTKIALAPHAEQSGSGTGGVAAPTAKTDSASRGDALPPAESHSVTTMDSPPLTTSLVSAAPMQPELAPMKDQSTYPIGAKPGAKNLRARNARAEGLVTETDSTPPVDVSPPTEETRTTKNRMAVNNETPSSQAKDTTAQAVTPIPAHSGYHEYQVVTGDSLFAIAKRSGVTIAELREWNGLTNSRLKPGQVLRIVDTSKRDPAADSKLLAAAEAGERRAVIDALDDGASLDVRNEEDRTALMLAASRGHVGIVRLLVDRGAPVDSSNELVGSALAYAAWNGHAQVVAALLDRGARVDVTNKGGWPPLIYAAINGHVRCVQQLLVNGADANARNLEGRTALSAAVWNRHTGVARALLDAGADVNTRTRDGWTPLLDAAVNGDAAMVSLLLSFGADPAIESETGMTALAIAEQRGNEDVVKAFSQARPSSS